MPPAPEIDDWIVAEYAGGVHPAEIGRRLGITAEQVLAVVSRTTTRAHPDPAPDELVDRVVAAYGQHQDPATIATQNGLTTDQVYEIVHRAAGIPEPYRMEPWVRALIIGAVVIAALVMAGVIWLTTEAAQVL